MKKTINISLGGLSFILEDDAYARLEAYLNKVKSHFAAYPDAEEIISDIESRLAEQLVASPGEGKIVALADVDKLIAVMGMPEQFGDEPKGEQPKHGGGSAGRTLGKRFYRNGDDVMLAGVASGLAAYIGVDTVWVRLVFALSIFVGGFGVALYIILWLIVPEAKTETEKMQMRGERVNLVNIEQTIKERVEEAKGKDRSGLKKGFAGGMGVGKGLGKLVKGLFMVITKIIGAVLSFAAAITIIALLFAVVSVLINANASFVDFPFRELAHGGLYYLTMISAFFVVLVPLLFIVWLGSSLLANKSTFSKMASLSLLGLWVAALIVAANAGFSYLPQVQNIIHTSPYFQTSTRDLDLKDFTKINVSGANQVIMHPANEFKVTAEGLNRDFDFTKIYVNGDTLVVKRENLLPVCFFCWHQPVVVNVYMPLMAGVSADGASRVSGQVEAGDFNLELTGASHADLSGTIENIKIMASGASRAIVSGAQIKNVEVSLSGASQAEFGDLESLKADASGASTLRYNSAKSVEQHMSGASRLVQAPPVQ